MKIIVRVFLPLLSLLFLVPCLAFGGPGIDSSTYVYKKVDGIDLKLDVYYPETTHGEKERLPAIIFFHGGGWRSGNRHQMRFQCAYFAAKGMVTVTADYRLLKAGSSMADTNRVMCLIDAKSAVRWVRSHAASLHIDTAKIAFGGGSAGGQLATMADLDHHLHGPDDDTGISTHAVALILFNPAYQLKDDPRLEPYRFAPGEFPPTIMFFGSEDHWKRAADVLYQKLSRSNARIQMWVAPGQRHAFFNKPGWNISTSRQAAVFLHALGMLGAVTDEAPSDYPLHREPGPGHP